MAIQKAKFSIGDVVKHKHFDFRGVIYDVDFEFNNSEEWYQSIPKEVRPKRGTKAFEDRTKKRAKAFVQFNNIDDRFKLILDQIAEAENIINNQTTFDPVTGNTGVLKSNIRGSNAFKLKSILNSITAKLGFQELKSLKMEGSTLGQVTEQERMVCVCGNQRLLATS